MPTHIWLFWVFWPLLFFFSSIHLPPRAWAAEYFFFSLLFLSQLLSSRQRRPFPNRPTPEQQKQNLLRENGGRKNTLKKRETHRSLEMVQVAALRQKKSSSSEKILIGMDGNVLASKKPWVRGWQPRNLEHKESSRFFAQNTIAGCTFLWRSEPA